MTGATAARPGGHLLARADAEYGGKTLVFQVFSLMSMMGFDMMTRPDRGVVTSADRADSPRQHTLKGRVPAVTTPNPIVPGVAFKSIKNYPDHRVGDDGSLWTDTVKGSHGKSHGPWRRIKATRLSTGYMAACLSRAGVVKRVLIHRLVLDVFVGPCPEGMECRHLDGDRSNNRLSNLAWGTRQANQADRISHGTDLRGSRVSTAKIGDEQAVEIRCLYATGRYTQQEIADYFGVSRSNVSIIIRRKGWRHT